MLAHEMRNLLNNALMSFASIRKGVVSPGGSTGAIHERSLLRLHALIDRSLADVRLDAGIQNIEIVPVWEIFEEVEIGALMTARTRGVRFVVTSVDPAVVVKADRQTLAAAVANLLQNAFKFTRPGTAVRLRAKIDGDRVVIEVEDECGGCTRSNSSATGNVDADRCSGKCAYEGGHCEPRTAQGCGPSCRFCATLQSVHRARSALRSRVAC